VFENMSDDRSRGEKQPSSTKLPPELEERVAKSSRSSRGKLNQKDASNNRSFDTSDDTAFVRKPLVGALEVHNVKKAINRYGTVPKGARIGQFLDSLKVNDNKDGGTQRNPAVYDTPGKNCLKEIHLDNENNDLITSPAFVPVDKERYKGHLATVSRNFKTTGRSKSRDKNKIK